MTFAATVVVGLDAAAGALYDAVAILADRDPRRPTRFVEAFRKSHLAGGLMQYGGPIVFNDLGDNPNAIPTMVQVLGGKPVAVWPREAAVQKLVFPRQRS